MRVPAASIYFPDEDRARILAQIDACLSTGQLTLGTHGQAFEADFAKVCGTQYAVAVNSGTSALEIILRAIGVQSREVVVPANTFYATAGAVVHAGGIPRFADCEARSFALDVESLRSSITPATAAVMVVHIGGLITPDLPEIQESATAPASLSSRTPPMPTAVHSGAGRPAPSGWRVHSPSIPPK